MQLQTGTHNFILTRLTIGVYKPVVFPLQLMRNQHTDVIADHLIALVTPQFLSGGIKKRHLILFVNGDHSIDRLLKRLSNHLTAFSLGGNVFQNRDEERAFPGLDF